MKLQLKLAKRLDPFKAERSQKMLNDFNPIIGSKHGSAECEIAMLKMDILINFVESMLKAFNSYEINDAQVTATEHVRYDLLELKEKYDAIRLMYVEKYAIEKIL